MYFYSSGTIHSKVSQPLKRYMLRLQGHLSGAVDDSEEEEEDTPPDESEEEIFNTDDKSESSANKNTTSTLPMDVYTMIRKVCLYTRTCCVYKTFVHTHIYTYTNSTYTYMNCL